MWATLGFILASIIGLTAVLRGGRSRSVRREEYPWLLDEISKLHVMIVGNLAGFAFTGVVLVVTLSRERTGGAQISLDTVIVMFLVAYLYWVGASFLISFLPHVRTGGDFVQRLHFGLASTIEYRTIFLSWFALLPLLQANGLSNLAPILYFLLPVSLLIGSVLLAMVTDGLGLLDVAETYVSGAIATGLALAYAALATFLVPGARSPNSAIYLTVVIFCLNGAGFIMSVITPLAPRYTRVKLFFDHNGKLLVAADMHLTAASLSFLWLAIVGVI